MKRVGVLALQGAFIEHVNLLEKCLEHRQYDAEVTTVRTKQELEKCDALIIPGGESTSMSLIAIRTGILEPLRDFVHDPEKAVWGTCAGLIFLAKEIMNESQLIENLDILKVRVKRNAFGRQSHSFIEDCDYSSFIPNCTHFQSFFIRAPIIEDVLDPSSVEVLHKRDDGAIVAVSQDSRILATSFHPELSDDHRFHDWFLSTYVFRENL